MSELTPEEQELLALTPEELALCEPIKIGPTWRVDPETQKWVLPERTLGWQIAGWCAEFLRAEDGGPWKFTLEQLRFVLWWYAVDENGRFIYRTGTLQRMKGWGKDPLLAVICLVEMCGPSRFAAWAKDGSPIGAPHPQAWVQVAAVNQTQTGNTMTLLPSLMSDHFIATYRVDPGAEVIWALGRKVRIQAVTSSYRAIEGARSTFVVLNETHHWVKGNNGIKMYEVIDGNVTKKDSRYLAITNAYVPGENSVAEKLREAYEKVLEGRALDTGALYDSLEAKPGVPLSGPICREALRRLRGDAHWLRVETIMQSIANTTLAMSDSRRKWLNQIVAEEEALYSREDWDPLFAEGEALMPGDEIVLGFDGGKTDDATALVAIRVKDSLATLLGLWEKPDGPAGDGWEVNRESVDSAVHKVFAEYDVKAFYADVALWESYISEWAGTYGEGLAVKSEGHNAISWDMRASLKRVTRAHERLMQTILDGKLLHDGNLSMRRHVMNARRRDNNFGVSFGKESRESPRKVDIYAALMLAHEALNDLRQRGKKVKKRTGRGYFL